MVTVEFSRPKDEIQGPTLGPYAWVQLTYGELRCAPDGDPIAIMYDDEWFLVRQQSVGSGIVRAIVTSKVLPEEPYSDIVIATKKETLDG